MKTHQLHLDDIFKESFQIIAIYSDDYDYRVAFLLNKYLNLQLHKSTSIINKSISAEFSVFEYEDESFYRKWFLLNNHCLIEKEVNNTHDLFTQTSTLSQQKKCYFKDLKAAHYLLKIEGDDSLTFYTDLIKKIQNIPQIYAAELIHLENLKNKKLLIF